MHEMPRSFKRNRLSNSVSTSLSVSAEVGSSSTSIFGSRESARAIATICCRLVERSRSVCRTDTSRPTMSVYFFAFRNAAFQSTVPRFFGIRPRKMFSATERSRCMLIS